jgi:HEPN domain-containing protein
MALDPERVRQVRFWFEKTEEDLRAVTVDLEATPPLVGDAGFHVQQAAEKAMKGFLTWHDIPFAKTHDLVAVGNACVAVDATLAPVVRAAGPLTEYAWRFRYPGSPEAILTSDQVQAGEAIARRIYEAILQRLPPEVKPR